jgi:hypothetical protein
MTDYVIRQGRKIEVVAGNTPPAKRKRFRTEWVKLPRLWIERLRGASSPAYGLALYILSEEFKRRHIGGDIVLSTASTGIDRRRRPAAVRELVGRGLILVEQQGRQASRVVWLALDSYPSQPTPDRDRVAVENLLGQPRQAS